MGIPNLTEQIMDRLRTASSRWLADRRQQMGHPSPAIPDLEAARLGDLPDGLEIDVFYYDRLAALDAVHENGIYGEWQTGRHADPPDAGLENLTSRIPAGGFHEDDFDLEEREDGDYVLSFPNLVWTTPRARVDGNPPYEERPTIQCFPVNEDGESDSWQVSRESVGEGEAERFVLPVPGRYVVYIWLRPRTVVLHWSVGSYAPGATSRQSYHFLVDDEGTWIPGGRSDQGDNMRPSWRMWWHNLRLDGAPALQRRADVNLDLSLNRGGGNPLGTTFGNGVDPTGYFTHAGGFNGNSVGVCFTGMLGAPNNPVTASWPLPHVAVLRVPGGAGGEGDEEEEGEGDGEEEAGPEMVRVRVLGSRTRAGAWQPLEAPDEEGDRAANTEHWQRIVQSNNEDDVPPDGHFDRDLTGLVRHPTDANGNVTDDTVALLVGGGTAPLEELPDTVRFRWRDRTPTPLKVEQILPGLRRVAQLCKAWDLDPMDPNDLCTHYEVDHIHSERHAKWDITWLPHELQVAYAEWLDHNGIERDVEDHPLEQLCENDDHRFVRPVDVPLGDWRSKHWDDGEPPLENTDRVGDFLRRLVKGMVVNDEIMQNPDVFESDDDGFPNFRWAWEEPDGENDERPVFQPYAADLTREDEEPTPDWA